MMKTCERSSLPILTVPDARHGRPKGSPLWANYGSCSARGCGCGGFQPTGRGTNYCAFCNHHWDMHR